MPEWSESPWPEADDFIVGGVLALLEERRYGDADIAALFAYEAITEGRWKVAQRCFGDAVCRDCVPLAELMVLKDKLARDAELDPNSDAAAIHFVNFLAVAHDATTMAQFYPDFPRCIFAFHRPTVEDEILGERENRESPQHRRDHPEHAAAFNAETQLVQRAIILLEAGRYESTGKLGALTMERLAQELDETNKKDGGKPISARTARRAKTFMRKHPLR